MSNVGKATLYTLIILSLLITAVFFVSTITGYVSTFNGVRKNIEKSKEIKLVRNSLLFFKNNIKEETLLMDSLQTYKLKFWASWCAPCLEDIFTSYQIGANTFYITLEDSITVASFINENKDKIKIDLFRMHQKQIPYEPQEVFFYPSEAIIKGNTIRIKK